MARADYAQPPHWRRTRRTRRTRRRTWTFHKPTYRPGSSTTYGRLTQHARRGPNGGNHRRPQTRTANNAKNGHAQNALRPTGATDVRAASARRHGRLPTNLPPRLLPRNAIRKAPILGEGSPRYGSRLVALRGEASRLEPTLHRLRETPPIPLQRHLHREWIPNRPSARQNKLSQRPRPQASRPP